MRVERSITDWLHKAVHALHFSAMGGLLYVLLVGLLVFYVISPTWLRPVKAVGYGVFAGSSFWNTQIPRYPTLHPNSATFVQDIQTQASNFGSNFDTTDKASPMYMVESGTPTVSVTPWDCDGNGINPDLATQWQAVPIPYYAEPGDGPTSPMIIYQPSTQTMWEFDHMRQVGGVWEACKGGRILGTGSSTGVFADPYGATDTGLPLIGGQVSAFEFQQGFIGHAVGLALPNAASNRSWPAARSGGNGASAIPQGLRLQLDPTLNINTLGLSAAGRVVAKAAQTYGFVVWDSAPTVSVRAENPKSATTRGLPNPYGGSLSGALANFPWDKLRALPPGYGQFGPLPPTISSFSTSATTLSAGQMATLSWQAIDVDNCEIPGVATRLAASGSTQSNSLHAGSSYTLACSSPGGSATRQLSIGVTDIPENSPIATPMSITITAPQSGYASVLPELATPEAAERVQKVVYYEKGRYLYTTTKPPFSLDTTRMSDGRHTLTARIYFRDGTQNDREVTITVRNAPTPLLLPPPPPTDQTQRMRTLMNATGMVGAFAVMGLTGWYGWRRTHWL